jgi:site-specific DNA-cytosine methylase
MGSEPESQKFFVVHDLRRGLPKGTFQERPVANTIKANYGNGLDNHGAKTMVAETGLPLHTHTHTNSIHEITKGVPQSQRVFSPEGVSMTLRAQTTGGPDSIKVQVAKERVRRLTPVECERLQGFPDGHTEGVSDTARYKACGNAVPTVLIEAVALRLFEGWS